MTDEKTAEQIAEEEVAKASGKEDEVTPPSGDDDNADDVIMFGDEEVTPPQEIEPAPPWVKALRERQKVLTKENVELKRRLEEQPGSVDSLGDKPTLEGSNYDNTKYEKDLELWYEKKMELERKQAAIRTQQEQSDNEWKNKLAEYQEKKLALRVPDFDEAEITAQSALSTTQMGLLISGADNSAVVMYALGKNPKRIKQLAGISDPVKFVAAVSKMEAQLKVSRRAAPVSKPEGSVKGSGSVSNASADKKLEKLREEAQQTGDFTKVYEYKRKLAQQK